MTDFAVRTKMLLTWRVRLRQVSGATLILVLLGLLARGITVLTQIVIVREFGATIFSDAYFAMETLPELFLDLLAGGLSMTFIPLFAQYRAAKGTDDAWAFTSAYCFVTTCGSLLLAAIAVAAAPLLVSLIAPGFDGAARATSIALARVMALSIAVLGLNAGLRGLFQSHNEFTVPDVARLFYNLALLAAAWFFSHQLGVIALAWGIVVGAFLQLLIQLWVAVKQRIVKPVLVFNHPGIWEALPRIPFLLLAVSWGTLIFLGDRIVASGLEPGSVTALNLATRIILLPVGIFAIPLRTAFYPTFSRLSAENDRQQLADNVMAGLQVLFFIVVPTCVGLVVLHVPLTQLLFEHGAFDDDATRITSNILTYYAFGVPAIAVIFFLYGVFFAVDDRRTLVWINILSWGVNLALNLGLSRIWGSQGIALATTIASTGTAAFMIVELKRRHFPTMQLRALVISVLKVSLIALAMGLLLIWLANNLTTVPTRPQWSWLIAQITGLTLVGMVTYLAAARMMRLTS